MKNSLIKSEKSKLVAIDNTGCWILRVDSQEKSVIKALGKNKIVLPKITQSTKLDDENILLGISNDEFWLISDDLISQQKWLNKVSQSLDKMHFALIDNSAGYEQFLLSGESNHLLNHLIAYNWKAVGDGKVISTVMQSVPIVFYKTLTKNQYRILLRRSFVDYSIKFINHTAQLVA